MREIIHGIYDRKNVKKLDIRIGGYFDEQVLSGSQGEGFAGRNEIFPHETSSNCSACTSEFVEHIKRFNMTYDVKELDDIEECPHCYNIWKDCFKVEDSREITKRVIDIL